MCIRDRSICMGLEVCALACMRKRNPTHTAEIELWVARRTSSRCMMHAYISTSAGRHNTGKEIHTCRNPWMNSCFIIFTPWKDTNDGSIHHVCAITSMPLMLRWITYNKLNTHAYQTYMNTPVFPWARGWVLLLIFAMLVGTALLVLDRFILLWFETWASILRSVPMSLVTCELL